MFTYKNPGKSPGVFIVSTLIVAIFIIIIVLSTRSRLQPEISITPTLTPTLVTTPEDDQLLKDLESDTGLNFDANFSNLEKALQP